MKKGSLKWFLNLTEEDQVNVFRKWRIITNSNKKHWCLNELKLDLNDIKNMLKELRYENTDFNNLENVGNRILRL